MTDSQERKAAVELQGLRDDLLKMGFAPRSSATQQLEEEIPVSASWFRKLRPMREPRALRPTRLGAKLRWVIEEVARWLGAKLRLEGLEGVEKQAAPKPQAETPKHLKPIRRPLTVGQVFEQREAARRRRVPIDPPTQSPSHSRGMGV